MEVEAQWQNAPFFHEIAEALGVTTTQIMAATPRGTAVFALFTMTEDPDDDLVYSAVLDRDADQILVVVGEPKAHPGMWGEILKRAEEELPGVIEQALKDADEESQ